MRRGRDKLITKTDNTSQSDKLTNFGTRPIQQALTNMSTKKKRRSVTTPSGRYSQSGGNLIRLSHYRKNSQTPQGPIKDPNQISSMELLQKAPGRGLAWPIKQLHSSAPLRAIVLLLWPLGFKRGPMFIRVFGQQRGLASSACTCACVYAVAGY